MFKILVVRCRILASYPSFNAYHSSEVAFAGSQSASASLSCLASAVIISPSYTIISKVTAANSHYLLAACRNRARYTVAVPLWCNYSWYAKARRAHASLRRATRVASRTWLHPPLCDTHTHVRPLHLHRVSQACYGLLLGHAHLKHHKTRTSSCSSPLPRPHILHRAISPNHNTSTDKAL